MRSQSGVLLVGAVAALSSGVMAQEQIVAQLRWNWDTAGPNGTTYLPPDQDRTLWIVEDFGVSSDVVLTRFQSTGTLFPTPPNSPIDVIVRVYDDLPTVGNVILESVPGTGHVTSLGAGNLAFSATFPNQVLPAGSYYVVWTVPTQISGSQQQWAIFWAQPSAHTVGGGQPDNARKWNPGGAWGYPGNIAFVPANLQGTGTIGVNFTLFGVPQCYPNCDGSTTTPVLNVNDFICFQTRFSAGDTYANCDHSTTPPVLNVNDFLCFQLRFAGGCS